MAGRRKVSYANGRLKGENLTNEDCAKLEALLKLNEENSYVSDLKNVICELTDADIELIKCQKSSDFVELAKGELTNLQTIGVAYMYFAKRLILGDSVGLGKTIEVCGLCNLLENVYKNNGYDFKFLLLTSKTLIEQTRDKMIKFTGNYVEALYGDKSKVEKFVRNVGDSLEYSVVGAHSLINSETFQEYLMGYESFYGCIPFDLIIIDESGDILSNSGTKTYKNAKWLIDKFDRAILLNATPFEKELRMFYNQIDIIDDTFLPTKTAFSKEYEVLSYSGPYPKFSGDYKNQEKFRELISYRYLSRTRRETGAKMIDCTAEVVLSDLSDTQKMLLKRVGIPNMVYDCPSYFDENIPTDRVTTPKIGSLLDLINGELKMEPSILVYCRYKETQRAIYKILYESGITSYIMNGSTSIKEKNDIVGKFKREEFRVLITNVQKGLDFGHCNACIFYDYDTNPNKMVQFEGRTTRSYDIVGKKVYLLISRGNELKSFKEVAATRADASDVFAGSDFSCVLSILLDSGKLAKLK